MSDLETELADDDPHHECQREVERLTALIPPGDWHNIDDVQEIRELKRQLAAETERADFAWKNTREIDAARMEQAKRLAQAETLLRELTATVRSECPRLLNKDSGGDARLSLAIDALLAASGEQKPEAKE